MISCVCINLILVWDAGKIAFNTSKKTLCLELKIGLPTSLRYGDFLKLRVGNIASLNLDIISNIKSSLVFN